MSGIFDFIDETAYTRDIYIIRISIIFLVLPKIYIVEICFQHKEFD